MKTTAIGIETGVLPEAKALFDWAKEHPNDLIFLAPMVIVICSDTPANRLAGKENGYLLFTPIAKGTQ